LTPPAPHRRLSLFWQFQLGGWLAHAIVSLPLKIAAFGSLHAGLVASLMTESVGLLLTLALRFVYRRLRLSPEQPGRLLVWVVLACAVAATIDLRISVPSEVVSELRELPAIVMFGFTWLRALTYVAWTILYFWIRRVITERERVLNQLRAEAAARDAELRMLRAQVDPHFLFNALNTVLAGLDRDPRSLSIVVQGLADYLRYSLAHRHSMLVPLGEEFDAAMNYLEVEKARFRDDLIVEAHIDDAARHVMVPGVFVQPLIENAVKHGYKSSPLPLRLRVSVESATVGGAAIEVANSGRWIDPPLHRPPDDASGVGLASLQRRLALFYPDTHTFEILRVADGVRVRVSVPAGSALVAAG
jgi:LytS/YehU family sensor histidine kinase